MSEYIEFVVRMPKGEADSLIARFGKENVKILGYQLGEEIVRCRDCKHYDGEPDLESSIPKCWRDPDHKGTPVTTYQDGFCAWGERREPNECIESEVTYKNWAVTLHNHRFTCGHNLEWTHSAPPTYCPVCGARVVDDGHRG